MKWDNAVATVQNTERLSPSLLRLRLTIGAGTGPGYLPLPVGDESVALYFSPDGTALTAHEPEGTSALGCWEIADEDRNIGSRNFSIRSYDPATREMVIDIAEHSHGPAIDWIRRAEPGWQVLMAGPRSWYCPPSETRTHFLAADLAGLPALARILEETSPEIAVTALVEVPEEQDLAYLPSRTNTTIIPLIGSGNGGTDSTLVQALAEQDIHAGSYCWLSAETAPSRAAKKHLRSIGLSRSSYDVVGYWRRNAQQWMERYSAISDEVQQAYMNAVTEGLSAQEASDLTDKILEDAGL